MNEENLLTPDTPGNKKGPLANLPPVAFIFLSLTIVFILYQMVGGAIQFYMTGADLNIKDADLNLTRILLTFAQFMFILAPSIVLVMLQDNNIKETFRLYKPKMSVFLLSIAGILVIQPFLQVYLYYQNELIFNLPFGQDVISQLKELFDLLETTTEKLVSADNIPEFLLIILVIAITPSICEEFLFRGLVFKNFEKVIPASKAMFFTGLLFALFHFHPFNLIPLMVLGIFLSFVLYHSGSMYTPVVCHFLNNFLSAMAVFIYGTDTIGSEGTANMTSDEKLQFLLLGAGSLAVFIALIFFIKKHSVMKDKVISAVPVDPNNSLKETNE